MHSTLLLLPILQKWQSGFLISLYLMVHNLLQLCMHVCAKLLQVCLTLCGPTDCSMPGSSVHRILQARILAISSSRGSSRPRDSTHASYVSCIGRQVLYHLCHMGSPCSRCTCLQFLVLYSFFVFCCSRSCLSRFKHRSKVSQYQLTRTVELLPAQSEVLYGVILLGL